MHLKSRNLNADTIQGKSAREMAIIDSQRRSIVNLVQRYRQEKRRTQEKPFRESWILYKCNKCVGSRELVCSNLMSYLHTDGSELDFTSPHYSHYGIHGALLI